MEKIKAIRERISVFVAQSPSKAILIAILLFNIFFLCASALIISSFAPSSLEHSGFWASIFYTITMILDAGCIQFVVADVGQAGVIIIVICLLIVLIGMISFTGAVIGYVTNYISDFIENSNSGLRKLRISDHTIILNWNSRASEIINELLYRENQEKVVVLVSSGRDMVKREISDRISDTISRENKIVKAQAEDLGFFKRLHYMRKNYLKNNLTVIIREGEVYSAKQLNDISVDRAKSIIILSRDVNSATECQYKFEEFVNDYGRGNSNIIKTLIQVADITADDTSADNQKIVVEIEDEWTLELVNRIIEQKEKRGKCNIVPVPINRILGQILSQFSIMPELNDICSELFSNKGAFFSSDLIEGEKQRYSEAEYLSYYLSTHIHAIPVATMDVQGGRRVFCMTKSEALMARRTINENNQPGFKLNPNFWLKKKNIVILGHNSKISSILDGFSSFRSEWNFLDGREILEIMIIDDKESIERNNSFKDYPYVTSVVEADIYDKETIYEAITGFADSHDGNTSVLILSDDMALAEEVDAKALTYLIYIIDLIRNKKNHLKLNENNIDVLVEVLNPRNYDVVCNYSVNNVVISNRYISKMITQIGEHDAIYDFYRDILTYDSGQGHYDSKEIYIKRAGDFFDEIPAKCSVYDLIRGIYNAGPDDNKSLILGYINKDNKRVLFTGNQRKSDVELSADDRLIIFSNH